MPDNKHRRSLFAKRLIALTSILLVACVLGRFAEYHWVFELLTHFNRHYFLAGLLLMGLLFWLRQWLWAVLAFSLAALSFPLIDGYHGVPETPCRAPGEGEELRILQFNIGRTNDQTAAFYPWLKLRSPLPHIIVILEASEKLEPSIQYLGLGAWPQVLTEYRRDNYGIAVASSINEVVLTLEPIGDPYLPSVVIKGVTDEKQLPFSIIATHPPPPLTDELAGARNAQFVALAERVRRDQTPNRIVVGDLNVTPWSPWFKQLLEDGGLRNAQSGFGHGGTFPTFGLPSALAIPIDHTLVSPNIHVIDRTIGPGFSLGSDHRLVETRLWLSECYSN